MSSELLPQYGLAIMRSNRWPGAVAFAKDRSVKYSLNISPAEGRNSCKGFDS